MHNDDPVSIRHDTPEPIYRNAVTARDEWENQHRADLAYAEVEGTSGIFSQQESSGHPELAPTLSTFTATAKRCDRKQHPETPQQLAAPYPVPPLPTLNTTQETPNHDQDPTKTKTSSGPTTLPSEKAGPLTLTIINETYYEITVRVEYSQKASPLPRYPYFFDTIPPRRNKKIEIPRHSPNSWLKRLTGITLFQGKELSGEDLDPVAIMTAKTLELTIYSQING